jgi:CRP-like cAMP-binding protein
MLRRLENTALQGEEIMATELAVQRSNSAEENIPGDLCHRLRRARFFSTLDDAALTEAAAEGRYHEYGRGELILGYTSHCYVVLSGAVRFYLLLANGQRITLGMKSAGGVALPGPSLPPSGMESCIEIAQDRTLLCRFSPEYIRHLVSMYPRFALEVCDAMATWCTEFVVRLGEMAYDHVTERLAHLLARLAILSDDHVVTETHDHLAWWIGTSRAKVTKELNAFRRLGLIAYEPYGRGIVVPDPHRLAAL